MRKFKPLLHVHQEAMERQVKDTLDDYSGIIHTLPMLVKLHEEAMEVFNSSREKDSVSHVGDYVVSQVSEVDPSLSHSLSLSLSLFLSISLSPSPLTRGGSRLG